jgi:hypothetical protein
MRTGDIVHHKPSGEDWVVAWADHQSGYMAPCGWPTCQARIDDCRLVHTATDNETNDLIVKLSESGRTDAHKAAEIAGRSILDGGREP